MGGRRETEKGWNGGGEMGEEGGLGKSRRKEGRHKGKVEGEMRGRDRRREREKSRKRKGRRLGENYKGGKRVKVVGGIWRRVNREEGMDGKNEGGIRERRGEE